MDISKYIGLFLIKSEYCYLPGIGNLKVVKKAAKYDEENNEMNSPQYTVIFEGGISSINDSFPNFIANNERISIVHASNQLREYCSHLKKKINEGGEEAIPSIGQFKLNQQGKIDFEIDPHLKVKGPSIPIFKNNTSSQDEKHESLTKIIEDTDIKEPGADEEVVIKPPTINWTRIIVVVLVIIAGLAVIGYFIYNVTQAKKDKKMTAKVATKEQKEATQQNTTPKNTTTLVDSAEHENPSAAADLNKDSFMVAVNTYHSQSEAQDRAHQLENYGNNASMWTKDSVNYYVVITLSSQKDKARATDSLKRIFNPNGDVKVVP